MVTFNNDGFTIEIKTGCNPIETWMNMHDDIISLLQAKDAALSGDNNYYYLLELLREMMPSWETAIKMMPLPTNEEY